MREKKKAGKAIAAGIVLLSAGAVLCSYPFLKDRVLEYQAGQEISRYEQAVEQEDTEKKEELRKEAEQYNQALMKGEAVSSADYGDLLAVTDAIGYLEIPKLGIYLPIYHGLDEEVLQKGIGHIPETSLPIGGESTHCVLSGHSGLPAARLLTELDQMEEGDRFYLHVLDQTLAYEVDQIAVVLPDDTSLIQIEEGRDYVTLLTCTPYGLNTHRLLVRGHRTENNQDEISVKVPHKKVLSWRITSWLAAMGIGLFMLLTGIFIVIRRRKKDKDKE